MHGPGDDPAAEADSNHLKSAGAGSADTLQQMPACRCGQEGLVTGLAEPWRRARQTGAWGEHDGAAQRHVVRGERVTNRQVMLSMALVLYKFLSS